MFLPSSPFLQVASYLNYGWLKQNVKDESLVQQRSMFIAISAIGEGHLLLVEQIYSELVSYRYWAFAVIMLFEGILFSLTD